MESSDFHFYFDYDLGIIGGGGGVDGFRTAKPFVSTNFLVDFGKTTFLTTNKEIEIARFLVKN